MNKCGCGDAGSILKSLTTREVWLHNDTTRTLGGTAVAYRKKQLGSHETFPTPYRRRRRRRRRRRENKEKSPSEINSSRTKSFDNSFGGYSRVSRFSKSIPRKFRGKIPRLSNAREFIVSYAVKVCY